MYVWRSCGWPEVSVLPHGSGKGSPEWWVANVEPRRVMFESYPNGEIAREAVGQGPGECQVVSSARTAKARFPFGKRAFFIFARRFGLFIRSVAEPVYRFDRITMPALC